MEIGGDERENPFDDVGRLAENSFDVGGLAETNVKAVIPDLVSERSEVESVGNPCLDVEGASILSRTDTGESHIIVHMR